MMRRCRNTNFSKGHDERTANVADFCPWIDTEDDKDRTNIEYKDTPDNVVDSLFQRPLRILGFTGSNPDEFNALE